MFTALMFTVENEMVHILHISHERPSSLLASISIQLNLTPGAAPVSC